MAIRPLNSVAGFSVGETPANIILANGDITTTNITTTGVSNLNSVGNVKITGGTSGQVLVTDGSGNLSFVTISTAGLSNGTTNISVINNGNITFSVSGNANVGTFTGTGLNVSGTLNATGTATASNFYANSGTVGASLLTGTLTTAAQPNITSVGTLTSLGVSGNITAANITANTGIFSGNGAGLTNIAGANVTGTVANATYATSAGSAGSATTAGTVTANAQPNITSVGTLSSVAVTGNGTFGNVYANSGTIGAQTLKGEGGNISNIQGANVSGAVASATSATTAGTVTTAAQPNITSVGTLTSLTVSGNANVGNLGTAQVLATANVTAPTLISNVANGTAPLTVTSTTRVANLNVSYANVADFINVTAPGTGTGYVVFANATTGNVSEWVSSGITSNLANNSITATTFVGALSGAATTAGTVTTNAQPNITSVGTLSSLSVTGNVTAGNVSGGNLVSANFVSGTLTTAAQPNITSVGNLSSLTVTGNLTAGNILSTNTIVANNGVQINNGALTVSAGNLDVTGNINVTGNLNYSNVTDLVVGDPLIYIGANNTGDLYDLGIVGSYNEGTYYHTGVARDHTNNYWTFFDGVVAEPTTVIDWANATYPTVKLGNLIATANANIGGIANITGNAIIGGAATVTGNVSGGNLSTSGALSVTGNANVGNLGTARVIATGNISGTQLISNVATGTAPLVVTSTTQVANLNAATAGTAGSATTAGTVTTNAQPNITSVGTLTSLSVSGNASAGNLNTAGAVVASTLTSNVATGTAPLTVTSTTRVDNLNVAYANVADFVNVTAPGTGTGYLMFANATTGNVAEYTSSGISANLANNAITATTFVGALSGAATSATTAGTVTTNAQPNITSVGTLTSLSVSGNASAGNISATNGNLTTANVSGNLILGNASVTTAISYGSVTTTAITANQTIASFSATGVTGVEFLVKSVDATGTKYGVATVIAVTDGTNVDYSTFGTVNLGGYTGALAVNIVGGQVRLQVTPASSNSTVWTTQYKFV